MFVKSEQGSELIDLFYTQSNDAVHGRVLWTFFDIIDCRKANEQPTL